MKKQETEAVAQNSIKNSECSFHTTPFQKILLLYEDKSQLL